MARDVLRHVGAGCRIKMSPQPAFGDWRIGHSLPVPAIALAGARAFCFSARAGAFVDQVEPALDPFETTIEIVEPTCEADVILMRAEDQLQGDLARVLGCILAHRSPVWPLGH